MKILHILYSGLGGHGNVFFSLVSADESKEFLYEALFNGIEDVNPEYKTRCNELGIHWNFVKKKPGIDLRYYKMVSQIIKRSTASIIFLHSSSYIFPALWANLLSMTKRKIVVRETQANQLKNKNEWFWLSLAFLVADKIIFLSEEYKNEIHKKRLWFYNKKKVFVIPNGIDLDIFCPKEKKGQETYVIGMQSRLTANKDHKTLLRAFALLKTKFTHARLRIAGDGECKKMLRELSLELKIDQDVEFTGMLDERGLVTFLQDLNLYVHASFGETMSTAIMQAMACGLPVIASNVPGINNMIQENKTGVLVPVNNYLAMSERIMKCMTDKEFVETISNNSLRYAREHFSNGRMFTSYKTLIFM